MVFSVLCFWFCHWFHIFFKTAFSVCPPQFVMCVHLTLPWHYILPPFKRFVFPWVAPIVSHANLLYCISAALFSKEHNNSRLFTFKGFLGVTDSSLAYLLGCNISTMHFLLSTSIYSLFCLFPALELRTKFIRSSS